jgi:hypothetical protein
MRYACCAALAVLQVGCTLFYSDVEVSQPPPGSVVRLFKSSWGDIREFNTVAYETGTAVYGKIPATQEVSTHISH